MVQLAAKHLGHCIKAPWEQGLLDTLCLCVRHCPGLCEDQLYMYLQQFGRVTDVYLPKGL